MPCNDNEDPNYMIKNKMAELEMEIRNLKKNINENKIYCKKVDQENLLLRVSTFIYISILNKT